jgi:uncharacterized protein YcaQ
MTQQLTRQQARRIALAAQGFTKPRPDAAIETRHVNQVIERLGFFQIDSVNVLQRAHYLPLFSRLGAYDTDLLHRAAERRPRRLVEYWAHEAALLDVRHWPAMRWRMADKTGMWDGVQRIGREQPEFVAWVLSEVKEKGPLTAREIEHDEKRVKDNWGWNWSSVKTALEYLLYTGQIVAAARNAQFERIYDLPERVLPDALRRASPLTRDEAHLALTRHAARALGVGTAQCFADYFRLKTATTQAAIHALVEQGELLPVRIEGWNRPAWRHRDAVLPRKVQARALLSPFDPLVFERTRAEKLFDFRYRLEIYTPAEKRVYGYYVLPFLLDDQLVARVDLKADRASSTLRVLAAWAEPHAPDPAEQELNAELRLMADWLGLENVKPARLRRKA